MSKTFKSALIQYGDRTLTVKEHAGHVNVTVRDPETTFGATVPSTDAPALALAILEAAGLVRDSCSGDDAEVALEWLHSAVARREREAKEAADREALEAEAMALWTALNPDHGFTVPPPSWVEVARTARELHGGTK